MKRGWKLLRKKIILAKPNLFFESWLYRNALGEKTDIIIKRGTGFSVIIPITTDRKIIVIKQFHYNLAKFAYTLPAGFSEPAETPLANAKRELLEETGFRAKKFLSLGTTVNGKYATGLAHFFIAFGCIKKQLQMLDKSEDISVELVSPSRFRHLVESGAIKDAFIELAARRALNYLAKIE